MSPYEVVDYMIPFYPDPFGLFVNMQVGEAETSKKIQTIDFLNLVDLMMETPHLIIALDNLRLLFPGQHSSCPSSRSPGITSFLIYLISNKLASLEERRCTSHKTIAYKLTQLL